MPSRTFLAVLLQVATLSALHASPLPIEAIQEIIAPNTASKANVDHGTLRISAVGRNANVTQVSIHGLLVCTKSICYRAEINRLLHIKGSRDGTGVHVADLAVPNGEIESVHFLPVGRRTAAGAVRLSKPLRITRELSSGEIMVVLDRADDGSYSPVFATANYIRSHGSNILFDPGSSTTVQLPYGVSLSIPAGALDSPTLLNVAVHDVGDEFPLIDIYPEISFSKPANLRFVPIDRTGKSDSSSHPGRTVKVLPPRSSSSAMLSETAPPDPTAPAPKTMLVTRTGVLRQTDVMATKVYDRTSQIEGEAAGLMSAPALRACLADLLHPITPSVIASGLIPTGTVNISWCETKAPFVHMTITDLNDSRERFTMRHEPEQSVFGSLMLPLYRITHWSRYTQAMINGFTWDGDVGNLSGQHGKANGFLTIGGKILGDNQVGGGYCLANCIGTSSGNKIVFQAASSGPRHFWHERDFVGLFGTYPNYVNYVSSSTSIMKGGICSTNADRNSWSAMGTTPLGQIIFMSSTSGNQTTAAELCELFKVLGATNAMRLDGGSATSMTIGGVLKNPLVGFNSFVFGSSRHIAYALKLSWVGW